MEYNTGPAVNQVMAEYYKRKWTGVGICAAAIIYLIYLGIFRMDYRISLVVGGFASFLLTLSVFVIYIMLAALAIFMLRYAARAISETLSEACDPYLYESCLNRLTVLFYKDRLTCNYALAQYYQGDFDRAWDTLRRVNIYKLKGSFKLNYYILLSALYFKRGMGGHVAELEQAYRSGIRNKREQKYFRMLCAGNNFIRAMGNHDYDAAFRFLREREALNGNMSSQWQRIGYRMREAQIYAALGEKESAKLNLQYVLQNGGRIFYVREAERLLSELTSEETTEEKEPQQEATEEREPQKEKE